MLAKTRAGHSSKENLIRRAFDWMFRDRHTGEIVIMQLPNLPLGLFLVASVIRRVAHPHGHVGTVVAVIAAVSLLWWAGDEVFRGVNPFRRILGTAVALITLTSLLLR